MSAKDFTPPWDQVYLSLKTYLTTWQEKPNPEASELAYVLADVAQTAYESESERNVPNREDHALNEDTLTKILEKAWQDLYRERKRAHALQDRIDRIQEVLGEVPDE